MAELWDAPAHLMVADLAAGRCTAEALVASCLERRAVVNPRLNAIVVDTGEEALAQARAVDGARAAGASLGPLAGLPFTAKLDYDVAGQATSQASMLMKDAVASTDSPMIRRMRAAGAILVGRTNEPDFGAMNHTHSSLYGPTLNPWDDSRTPGGSSGGEAVAIATGMSPLGLGSDYGGSIRTPASFTGVVGFKPGLGRYPIAAEAEAEPPIHSALFTARGPLARSVQDVILVDEVLRGVDRADPWTVPQLVDDEPRKVGVVHSPTDTTVPSAIVEAVDRAADALRASGYEVVETTLALWPELAATYGAIALADFGGDEELWQFFPEPLQRFLARVRDVRRENAPLQGSSLGSALARRHRLAVEFNAFHRDFDVLLMPTWTAPPFLVSDLSTAGGIDDCLRASLHLSMFNLLGLPTLSVPVAIADGLPIGVQLSSTPHRDAAVLTTGLALERQLGPFPSPPFA